jgi:acyl-CoA oxidase
MHKNPHI